MTSRWLRRGAALLALLFVLGIIGSADAKRKRRRRRRRAVTGPRVVLLSVTGPRARRVYSGLHGGLRRRVRLVSRRAFFRAIKKLGVDPTTDGGIRAACAQARCAFVVRGSLKRSGRRYDLAVTVTHADTGNKVSERTVRVRSARGLTTAGRRMASKLVTAIRRYSPPPPPAPKPPKPPPEPPSKPVVAAAPAPTVTKKPDGSADARSRRQRQRDAMVIVAVGIGISTRDIELAGPGETDLRRHGGGAFAELTFSAEVYPLVPLTTGFARHIGIWATFSQHLGVSTGAAATLPQGDFGGGARQLVAGALVRVPLGPVTLRGALGLGVRDFSLDANNIVPAMSYRFVDIAISGSIPLGTPLAVASLGVAVRPLVGAGQDTVNALGDRDGGIGWTVGGGVSGRLAFGLMYFARVEYQSFHLDFVGLGSSARAPLPGTFERAAASSAVDRYLRAWGGLGYAF